MYLHLGAGAVVRKDSIVGVFDLDNTSQSHLTRKYLAAAEKKRPRCKRRRGYSQKLRHLPRRRRHDRVSEPNVTPNPI